ncbi:MAG TPA: response regulator [Bryobacteraceae bacterium]|nr:response regulator [Bryobacteraceae bacterium]
MPAKVPGAILLVDDAPATALELALADVAPVQVLRSALAAARLIGSGAEIAAVVTDLEMPSLSGFDLIRLVRGDPRHVKTPIVVVSGAVDPDAAERVFALGADAYFSKPCSPAEVRRRVEGLINGTRQSDR